MSEHVFITGGDGYVGRLLAQRYLTQSDARLTLLVRGTAATLSAKVARMRAFVGEEAATRIEWLEGDITDPGALAGVDTQTVTTIVHSAAVTRFNVEQPLARAVNVEGTAHVLALAQRCRALRSLGVLSTVYSSGLRPGPIDEAPLDDQHGFANFYEWSKFESERLAWARKDDLPIKIIRLSTVIADDDSGHITQQNAFHNTLKLYFHGLLSLLPGNDDTPVYVITGRFAADALMALLDPQVGPGFFHLSHEAADSPTLGSMIGRVFDRFDEYEGFQRRRVLRPVRASQGAFDDLAEGIESFGGDIVKQALRSMTPFARQLYVKKQFSNQRMRMAFKGYRPEPHDQIIDRVSRYLVNTRWGRQDAAA
jgi:nucleoside-diphosphate-sugar epimerase